MQLHATPTPSRGIDPAMAANFKAVIATQGVSMAQWARDQGFNVIYFYRVLNGYEQGTRGRSKDIADAIRNVVTPVNH